MSAIVDVANAVVGRLNEAPGLGFTAELGYLPRTEVGDFSVPKVFVFPFEEDISLITRGDHDFAITIRITLVVKVDATDEAEMSSAMDISESIIDRLRSARLSEYANALPTTIKHAVPYDVDSLEGMSLLLSRIDATYRVRRSIV